MARSQAFRRPKAFHRVGAPSLGSDDEDDDDEHSSGGFLPFAATTAERKEDPAATLRSPPPKRTVPSAAQLFSESSASSASSAAAAPAGIGPKRAVGKAPQTARSPADALSPRRRAELAKLSPRMRKEGSEGTPSMGSSFSDLDGECRFNLLCDVGLFADGAVDASISQSALEDAFLSTMQHGAASRISNISQALKSKYL